MIKTLCSGPHGTGSVPPGTTGAPAAAGTGLAGLPDVTGGERPVGGSGPPWPAWSAATLCDGRSRHVAYSWGAPIRAPSSSARLLRSWLPSPVPSRVRRAWGSGLGHKLCPGLPAHTAESATWIVTQFRSRTRRGGPGFPATPSGPGHSWCSEVAPVQTSALGGLGQGTRRGRRAPL